MECEKCINCEVCNLKCPNCEYFYSKEYEEFVSIQEFIVYLKENVQVYDKKQ